MNTWKIVEMSTHFLINLLDESAKGTKKKETLYDTSLFFLTYNNFDEFVFFVLKLIYFML